MRRTFAAILLVAVLAVGAGVIATTAYQAGLSTTVTQAVNDGATAVTPVVVPAYGYGWGPGFGFGHLFFGFLGTLFFLFLVFGLIRAIFWGGRHRGGPGGWGPGWDPDARRDHYASKFHGTFEQWHREAHEAPRPPDATPPTSSAPSAS